MKRIIQCLLLGAWGLWSVLAAAAVDANTANVADLDSVKGIGPSTSSRIVEARKAGPFKDWADFVARVRGIGPGSAAKLSDNGLTINGQTYTATTPVAAKSSNKPAAVAVKPEESAAKKP
ncbi:ComEA family DNA-binding protein [Hydrogenophaga defluvii]|uniref:ComEA family DNA-binding protein n=1 Tax=Hydrogenophaga defluvii TaxID=249410 RepID=A0ABW2SJN8_9BURK